MTNTKKHNWITPVQKQTWAASAVLLTMVGQGMLFGFPSSLLPALMKPDSPIKSDLYTSSWLASSVGLAGIPGFFISSFLMVYWGRRIAYALALVPGTLGWTLVFFASNIPTLLIGRILGGVTAGACLCLGSVVLGEYSSPNLRGMFLNLKSSSVCLGGMIVHILEKFFTWRFIAMIALMFHIVAFLITLTWPESPAWLASQQLFKECENAFFWLRSKNIDSIRELNELISAQKNQIVSCEKDLSLRKNTVEFFKKFTRKDFNMPILIIVLGAVLMEVCGRHWFPAFALGIIGEITGDKAKSFYYTIGLDIVITGSSIFSSILVKLIKRRTLLFTTGSAAVVVNMATCVYLFLVSRGVVSKEYSWIPIILLVVYFILANLGCTPIPLAYLGEMMPLSHRGAGSVVGGIVFPATLQFGLQVTPFLLASVKVHGTFAIMGAITGVCLLILYVIVPETNDKTLQEIEDYFVYGNFRGDHSKRIEEATEMLELKD